LWMDRTPVTNAEFERFVNATGFVTVAERQLEPEDFPGVCAVGGQAPAHGSGVRVRRARRPRSKSLSMGQRADPGRQGRRQHMAGTIPRRKITARTATPGHRR
jgi:formylglycine-generating enzyme required for sulfatase activity